jgi:hypothetical protein
MGFYLKDIGKTFGKRTTSYRDIVNYFNKTTNRKLDKLFSAYLQYAEIPIVLQSQSIESGIKTVKLNLNHPQSELSMRVYYTVDGKESQVLLENSKPFILKMPANAQFEVNKDKGYFEVKEIK